MKDSKTKSPLVAFRLTVQYEKLERKEIEKWFSKFIHREDYGNHFTKLELIDDMFNCSQKDEPQKYERTIKKDLHCRPHRANLEGVEYDH